MGTDLVVGVLSVASNPSLVGVSVSSSRLVVFGTRSSSTEHVVSELVLSVLGRGGCLVVVDASSSSRLGSVLGEGKLEGLEVESGLLGRFLLLLL